LPPILPLVLYHGEQEWTAATELQRLFDLEGVTPEAVAALRPFLPKLQIMVDEVGRFPDEMLPGQGVVKLTLLPVPLLINHHRMFHFCSKTEKHARVTTGTSWYWLDTHKSALQRETACKRYCLCVLNPVFKSLCRHLR